MFGIGLIVVVRVTIIRIDVPRVGRRVLSRETLIIRLPVKLLNTTGFFPNCRQSFF